MLLTPRANCQLCGRLWAITDRATRSDAVLAATLLAVVACTSQPTERPAAGPTRTPSTSAAPAPTAADDITRTPLVVAVHPTRQGLALTGAQLAALRAGTVTDWADLGAPAATLRTGSLDEVPRTAMTSIGQTFSRMRPTVAGVVPTDVKPCGG
jgi:hypothetical protein